MHHHLLDSGCHSVGWRHASYRSNWHSEDTEVPEFLRVVGIFDSYDAARPPLCRRCSVTSPTTLPKLRCGRLLPRRPSQSTSLPCEPCSPSRQRVGLSLLFDATSSVGCPEVPLAFRQFVGRAQPDTQPFSTSPIVLLYTSWVMVGSVVLPVLVLCTSASLSSFALLNRHFLECPCTALSAVLASNTPEAGMTRVMLKPTAASSTTLTSWQAMASSMCLKRMSRFP